jgi:hypothetical protein
MTAYSAAARRTDVSEWAVGDVAPGARRVRKIRTDTRIYPNLQREFVNPRGLSRRRPNKSVGVCMSGVLDAETGADYHLPLAARQARRCHDGDAASKEVGWREDLGPIQDTGALPTRSNARGEVRPLHVHVSPAQAGRVQVGAGTDPRRRNMRRIHWSPR